ncbi:myosin heavy chain, embryonic smooth muscle isoform [Drosophila pseudoobscura]|uniref:Myosin heavy chain, embryonic smooth muscle isoform n=1 Tax=Drosophila pseudoobscura pseudoobscura TaxID=46245 RepID=A0A6I8UYV6_DROPS|nr:myosin heavy chain, embryonic smooth muscle isoform [Drosophila pseudoobscura]
MKPAIKGDIWQQQRRSRYGAWDDPGVSMFAVIGQEPIENMLTMMTPLPLGTSDFDKEAYPMLHKTSDADNAVFRTVKFQVEQLALNRTLQMRPKEEQKRIDNEILRALVKERRSEMVAASRRIQLQRNVPELRDLQLEINVAKTALSVRKSMLSGQEQKCLNKKAELDEARAQQKQVELQLCKERLVAEQKSKAFREALMSQLAEATKNRLREQQETQARERRELLEFQKKYALELSQEAEKVALRRKELQESLKETSAQKQAALEIEARKNVTRPQRGILDSFGPTTAAFVAKDMKRRADEIQAREINSARLGAELNQIRRDRETNDELFIDLLEREYRAKDTKKVLENIAAQQAASYANREEVCLQRKAAKYFREQWAAIGNNIPRDSTSFGERQHSLNVGRNAMMQEKNMQCHREMVELAIANKHHRKADAESTRNITSALAQLQNAEDLAVKEERLRMLRSEPREVLNAIRPFALTASEHTLLNLETSKRI